MGHNAQDEKATSDFMDAGAIRLGFDAHENQWMVETWICPEHLNSEDPVDLVARAIEASDRLVPNLTICLKVEGDDIPEYLISGIEKLADSGYPAKVIVVCGDYSTHKPGNLLSNRLIQAVAKCNPGGMLWHPIAKIGVHGPTRQILPQAAP
ncbi:hypothetical protein [Pseudomonas sp. PS02290]|uniref:hypothetical protein n=1 Tax=Pseudomonas sp. PS02290 TaxID=2991430 RepID=UPI00249AF2F1|nr:hypothetical protein [Pseudomonas sp. PS02290]